MILITGASGLLGANLVLTGNALGQEIVAGSNRHGLSAPGIRALRVDLAAEGMADAVVRELQPEWIIHCAAVTDVDWCEDHPQVASRVNAEVPRELASASRAVGSRFCYVSTDSVFGGVTGNYREEDPPHPLNVYASSKLAGEEAVRQETRGDGLIIRTNIYGWNMLEKKSLAEWVIHRLTKGLPTNGFADVTFSPISANDLADQIWTMVRLGLSGIYHVSGAEAVSKYEFAVRLARVFELDETLIRRASIRDSGLRAARPLNTSLATGRACRALGRDMPSVEAGLAGFLAMRESGFAARLRRMREM